MKVLGFGLPRTGTSSLRLALEQLGYGPCYHMQEALARRDHDELWLEAARTGSTDWQKLFGEYGACVDAPSCWFAAAIACAFPEAKCILTVRDRKAWLASASSTVFAPRYLGELKRSAFGPVASATGKRFLRTPGFSIGESPMSGPETALRAFDAHNAYIQRLFDDNRLLIFDVNEGWRPLCHFLGERVPSCPFPSANSRADFFERMHPESQVSRVWPKVGSA